MRGSYFFEDAISSSIMVNIMKNNQIGVPECRNKMVSQFGQRVLPHLLKTPYLHTAATLRTFTTNMLRSTDLCDLSATVLRNILF